MELTLEMARRLVDAGLNAAAEIDVPMNIAVVDSGGHLVHFARMDGAMLGSLELSIKKAVTANLFRVPTATVGELSQPGGAIYGIEHSHGGLVSFGGGLPLPNDDGLAIGAVGVSGGTVEQDVSVAEACVGALLAEAA